MDLLPRRTTGFPVDLVQTARKLHKTVFIMVAISIHSIFSGLALGVASSSTVFWSIFTAIMAHKFFDGFVIGANAVKGKSSWQELALVGTPALLAEPLGILIGMSITSQSPWIEGIMLSLVAGAFLYIGATEVGPMPLQSPPRSARRGDGQRWGIACTSRAPDRPAPSPPRLRVDCGRRARDHAPRPLVQP